jgi:hypothetical protein
VCVVVILGRKAALLYLLFSLARPPAETPLLSNLPVRLQGAHRQKSVNNSRCLTRFSLVEKNQYLQIDVPRRSVSSLGSYFCRTRYAKAARRIILCYCTDIMFLFCMRGRCCGYAGSTYPSIRARDRGSRTLEEVFLSTSLLPPF